jgi:ParB family chromosome partitioning protein
MSKAPSKKKLGRGLSALLADVDASHSEDHVNTAPERVETSSSLPLDLIEPNPDQPRRDFGEAELEDLTRSIKEKGVLQPLIVRPLEHDKYQIVAGERRWRAAQRAQVHDVPVIVRELSDTEVLEIAIIENIQRQDLNPIEEAMGYQQLMTRFGHTQEILAEALGKSRSHVANLMRLLKLPQDVLSLVRTGALSSGHARALITATDPSALASDVVKRGLSVRQTEALAKSGKTKSTGLTNGKPEKDADTRAIEADLTAHLGLKVAIEHGTSGNGELRLRYKNLDELDGLCQLLLR